MITRLITDIERMVRAVLPELPFLGTYRYRVVQKNPGDDRWHLQPVNTRHGLPDMVPIPIRGGTAGLKATMQAGAIVLVSFAEGDRNDPFISHVAAPDDGGWLPVTLTLDATTSIKLGDSAVQGVARLGDTAGPYIITSASTKVVSE